MERLAERHYNRVYSQTLTRYSASTIAKWVTDNTYYASQRYSYLDHEYQERILNDDSRDINVRKCSQVGISEASARKALALVNVFDAYTVAYTLPTAGFAATFVRTRVDPIIDGSDELKDSIHKTNDNSEVKQFGASFAYFRGAASSNAPISIPVDHLIHDEVDFSDQDVLSQYKSRLTHSKHKRTDKLSTPTVPGFGIDLAFQESRRHYLMCRCSHCNHRFIPSYYDHVKIPGYTGDLHTINKQTLTRIRYTEAAVHCPRCGLVPSLLPEFREWVCENPTENYVAAGYQVSPFDAPNIIKPSYLVEVSTQYTRVQDFVNFNLGLPLEDKEATLTAEDFEGRFTLDLASPSSAYVMGIDVGNLYHFKVGAVDPWGAVHCVHMEQVPMGQARKRYGELRARYRPVCSVIDSGPHAETVMALQETDPNLFAAVYTKSKSLLTHTVVNKDEDEGKGQEFVRQVNINRSRALDAYMELLRSNKLTFRQCAEQELVIQQHQSMKRVKTYDNDSGELVFSWQKTDGNDHFHHAGVYMHTAAKIRALGRPTVILPTSGLHKFRLKQH